MCTFALSMKDTDKIIHEEYYYASGPISGSLDAFSANFTGYEKLSVRSRQPGNILYRAQRYGRYYVLKSLASEYRDDPAMREYLSKEYQIGVQLDHPHIVRVNSLEEDPKLGLCIVMEYVDGLSLDQWLLTKPSAAARKRIIQQILDAMAYCHERQIWHLDLKPSNILITKDGLTAKIIDFGLSDNSGFAFRQTGGTRKYAAPEQLAGQVADHRSDIYALGGILKRMFPHRYGRAVRRARRTDPSKRLQSVAALAKLMRQRWWLWMLPVLIVGLFCWWMHPDGKKFPVTLDSGQTVYAKVLSHWQRKVSFVCPSEEKAWFNNPDAPSGNMIIPAHIRCRGLKYRVVEIDTNAFNGCNDLKHLTISEGVESIRWGAFGCILLEDTIVIPRSLKRIESLAFHDCNSITTLIWKASGTNTNTDDELAFFYRCNSLKKAIVDDSVDFLPSNVFRGMEGLEEIVLPNHLRKIPENMVVNTRTFREIKLPDSLQAIEGGAFYLTGIERIVIPDKTEKLLGYCFSYCYRLREVDIGTGMKQIGSYAFNDNRALETMIVRCEEPPTMLPNAIYGIPESAVLYVPAQSLEKYRKDEVWGKFRRIEPISS